VLDAGEALNGAQGLGLLSKGEVQVKAMNLMGYDAMTLGSGDFVIGWDQLEDRMEMAQFPMLSANVVLSETGELVGQPYIIKEVTPEHRVAIIGLTDPYAAELLSSIRERPVLVLDPVETARQYVDEVSDQANVILVLSHLGYDQDEVLARQIPEIDAIIGGKSGQVFDPPLRPDPLGPVFAQVGSQGMRLGVLRLDFDDRGKLIQAEGHPITLGPDVPDDPEMDELLESYKHLIVPTQPPVLGDGE
jgi:5'-nucleotidase/UDP-sugar diphosphatase